MHHAAILTFSTFGACSVLLVAGMLLAAQLFKLLDRDHARYYRLIGRPKVFGHTDSFDGYSRRLKGAVFIYSMVFKGVPSNFPEDARARKMAQAARYVFMIFIAFFVLLLISTYFYYKSGQ